MYMQSFMPTPLGAQYQTPMALYAQGGHVGNHNLHQEAENLRSYGVGQDRILAHINPAEAAYLSHHHGMSVNPHTGLPQFGFFDMLKSGASALGNAAMSAAPSLWSEYGRPLAQQGLQSIDQRVQGALPGLGQALGQRIGGQRFGESLGNIGQSFGQNLSNQYGKYGGLAGQVLPRVDSRLGVQGPSQFPQVGMSTPFGAAKDVGRGVWGDVGQGMARQGLQNVDQRMMNALPQVGSRIGSAIGNKFGFGQQGGNVGSNIGNAFSDTYGNTPGISGYAMPRMNSAVNNFTSPAIQPFAQGGQVGGYNPMPSMPHMPQFNPYHNSY